MRNLYSEEPTSRLADSLRKCTTDVQARQRRETLSAKGHQSSSHLQKKVLQGKLASWKG